MQPSTNPFVALTRPLLLALPALTLAACTLNLNVPAAVATATTAQPAPGTANTAAKPAAAAPAAAPAAAAATPSGNATSISASSWSEQFSARDSTSFLSPAYAAIPSDGSKALYATSSPGSLRVGDGALTLNNARFTVGALGATPTTSSTPGGSFAMVGKTCSLTLNVRSVSGTGNFYVYVDNNTTSQDNSPHGKASRVVNVGVTSLIEGQNIFKWAIPKTGYTGESFMQIRADSASTIVVDSANLNCA